jgi:hypothetical protein
MLSNAVCICAAWTMFAFVALIAPLAFLLFPPDEMHKTKITTAAMAAQRRIRCFRSIFFLPGKQDRLIFSKTPTMTDRWPATHHPSLVFLEDKTMHVQK